jgi:Ca2+-binding RTX toxin-like protein
MRGVPLLAVVLAIVLSFPAQAATVQVSGRDAGDRIDVGIEGLLLVDGRRGEANRITITQRGRQSFEVRDSGARLRLGKTYKFDGSCRRTGRHVAVCRIARPVFFVYVDAGDRDDTVSLRGAKANVTGGAGNDRLRGGPRNDRLDGGPGADRIAGGPGSDVVNGDAGRDTLRGGAGNDSLGAADGRRGRAPDRLDGGAGRDIASWGASGLPVRATLNGRTVRGERDRGRAIEGLRGGTGDDRLTGGRGPDRIEGGSGDNVLIGRGGNDVIVIGGNLSGINEARCGPGRDAVGGALLRTLVGNDCEGLFEEYYEDGVVVKPSMRLRPGGRLEVSVPPDQADHQIKSAPRRFPGVPRGTKVRTLGRVVAEVGQIVTFDLSQAGRAYVGKGGRPVCYVEEEFEEFGYCMGVR